MTAHPDEGKQTVLVVDDEEGVRSFLKAYLSENGFHVLTSPDGLELAETIKDGRVDLLILDLILAEGDGVALARDLRTWSDVPIIMLTGRGEEVDRVVGLEVGADDYVAKPFSARELLARIKSVLRRTARRVRGDAGKIDLKKTVSFAGWCFDQPSRKLVSAENETVKLTPGQSELLSVFVTHPKIILGREQLLDLLGSNPDASFDRSVDVQVMRLRRKIEKNPKKPELIKTVRTGGYLFTPDVAWR